VPVFFWAGVPHPLAKHALSETARVLKPGGKFILYDFAHFDEQQGLSTLTKSFPKFEIHTPTKREVNTMGRAYEAYLGPPSYGSPSHFDQHLASGNFRSFVGIKTE
jgi:SAM-dependent methyltransferase